MKIGNIKLRPGILFGELMLGAIAIVALVFSYETVATAAVAVLGATLPKLVESEEKSNDKQDS